MKVILNGFFFLVANIRLLTKNRGPLKLELREGSSVMRLGLEIDMEK